MGGCVVRTLATVCTLRAVCRGRPAPLCTLRGAPPLAAARRAPRLRFSCEARRHAPRARARAARVARADARSGGGGEARASTARTWVGPAEAGSVACHTESHGQLGTERRILIPSPDETARSFHVPVAM